MFIEIEQLTRCVPQWALGFDGGGDGRVRDPK
jgi:hypothetical protein